MTSIQIGSRSIGATDPVYIIAEAGVNHNGDITLAKKLIEEAKGAGADCVKFQTFKAEEIVTSKAPKADYQLGSTDPKESQFSMLKKLELPKESFQELMRHCQKVGIQFLSTPYSFNDIDLLDKLGVPAFKVASGQLTEIPFLQYMAKKGKPIILSTGMATLAEIRESIDALQKDGHTDIILLQCTTNYPSKKEDTHLKVITTFQNEFGIPVGYSDHTVGPVAILGAVTLGACVIEKHFTLDKNLPGPDHASSIEPAELKDMVELIRDMSLSLGTGEKTPTPVEIKNAQGMKRSLTSTQLIPKGTQIEAQMITFKRPATGIPPKDLNKVLGKITRCDIPADSIINFDQIIFSGTAVQKVTQQR
jgi:N-acetylneuraminate synthase/N,N'-diacetyllegionaminate synthase